MNRQFIRYFNESNDIVFIGGAGVSTESGMPDFRSKNGLYNQENPMFREHTPEDLLSKHYMYHHPKLFYQFYKQCMDVRSFEPNITHKVLAELEQMGKLKAIVTQNVDGLHQKAGSKTVYEIHGSARRNHCVKCQHEFDENFIFDSTESIPKCPYCHRPVRPDIVLYGEKLPKNPVKDAMAVIKNADMLIIGGTSLQVQPAANFVNEFHGKHLVVINKEPLDLSNHLLSHLESHFVFKNYIGDVFREIEKHIQKPSRKG